MALFTDGQFGDINGLRAYESSIVGLAHRECIDLQVKLNIAYEEIGEWLLAFLLDRSSDDPQAAIRRKVGLSTLVVSKPLERWLVLRTLELVFRDAHHGQLNEHYKENWLHYRKAAESAREVLFRSGIGFVAEGVGRARIPEVEVQGGSWPAGFYRVAIQWVSAKGQRGGCSETVAVEAPVSSGLRVTVGPFPEFAAGWDVYVGSGDGPWIRQNIALVETQEWASNGVDLLTSGSGVSSEQQAEIFARVSQVRL